MRKIVSAKMLGTDKRIIGYLLDEPTGQFVSTYTVPGPSGKQLILKAEKVNSESIIFLMNEPEIDESIEGVGK